MQPSRPACSITCHRSRIHAALILLLVFATAPVADKAAAEEPSPLQSIDRTTPTLRTPLDVVSHGSAVFTANSRTGSITAIDQKTLTIIGEWSTGGTLSAIESNGRFLIATDESAGRLLVMTPDLSQSKLLLNSQHSLPTNPVDLAVSSDGGLVAVSSLWSRTVSLLTLDSSGTVRLQSSVSLPFCPRRLLFIDCCTVIAADSFGGNLAALDATSGRLLKQFSVHGHNIRGLAVNPRTNSLLVSCQTLDSSTFTTYERVFWGVLMQNGLHSLPLNTLFSSSPQPSFVKGVQERSEFQQGGNYAVKSEAAAAAPAYARQDGPGASRYPLGTPSIGSGDPGAIVVTSGDITALVLSGTSQIAFRMASHLPFERITTGRRPEALCLSADQSRAFIANRFEDSLTVLAFGKETAAIEATVALGTMRSLTEEDIGEQTFFNAQVSLDGWYSCHSCHTDGHTNGMLADTFGDEDRGAPKKVISLLGSAAAGPWAWNGARKHLEDQIHTSLLISMQSQISTEQLPVQPLAAWLRTLQPAPGIATAGNRLPDPRILQEARRVFETVGCTNCHAGRTLTSADIYDVGIHDEQGETRFNPPSLSGVSQRAPYFHDGRAATLEDVLRSAHHNPNEPLTDHQIQLLLNLLETL